MSVMTLTRIRRGFATNSSSFHSILELEPGQDLPPVPPFDLDSLEGHWCDVEEYENLLVSDRGSRIIYLHAIAAESAKIACRPRDEAEMYRLYLQLASAIPGEPLGHEEMSNIYLGLDYAVPRRIHTRDMDVGFFSHIVRFVMSENVVVFCSRQTSDSWVDLYENLKGEFREILCELGDQTVSRQVSENEWTLFDTESGEKLSVRFDDAGRQTVTPIERRALEMVDVSISNACSRQCPFCYRASTPGGPLADIGDLKKLVDGLKEADAMELVIGGGEPTEHPDFYMFLKDTDFGDLCPSFTTRNFDFIRDLALINGVTEDEVLQTIRKKVKAIGLSVRTVRDIWVAYGKLYDLFENAEGYAPQMVLHMIPEPGWQELVQLATPFHKRVLLLGMKFTGRNTDADRQVYQKEIRRLIAGKLIGSVVHSGVATLGVDTKFIADVKSVNPDWLKWFRKQSWSDVEGERGAFIDLVGGTMSSCSFGGETVALEGYDAENLLKAFAAVGTYTP